MRRSALITSVLMVLAGATLVFASSSVAGAARKASAPTAAVGIGDEQPTMFGNPAFLALHTHIARYVTPYDVADQQQPERPPAAAPLACRGGARPHPAADRLLPLRPNAEEDAEPQATRPMSSASSRQFPQVKLLQPWNEANRGYVSAGGGSFQSPSACQSAAYYLDVRSLCRKLHGRRSRRARLHRPRGDRPLHQGVQARARPPLDADDLGPAQLLRHQPLPLRAARGRCWGHDRPGLADRDGRDREAQPELPVQPLASDAGDRATCSRSPGSRGGSPACTSSSGRADTSPRSASTRASATPRPPRPAYCAVYKRLRHRSTARSRRSRTSRSRLRRRGPSAPRRS